MKGPVKLSLAIALALAGGNAFALGLGAIQVKSGLNQPLDAEIPVLADSPAEANALTVDLASNEDFERVGLSRSRIAFPIEMAVSTNARGQTVVKLTTKEAVREPLLDFLLVANWPKGKLLREFTILLDPPLTAPAKTTAATVAPVAEKPAAAAPQPLAPAKAPAKPARAEPKPPTIAATPKPASKPAPAPAPAPAPKAAPASAPASASDYGPVAAGETLSEIARATRPDEKTSVDQMMLALYKSNPKAFYQDNINALKRGAILRIPGNDEMKANGSAREVADQIRSQNEAWSGKVPVAAPTLVAHTGASTKPEPAPKAVGSPAKPAKAERLALVPPSSGKSDAAADRAGKAGGTGTANADIKAELARTKETLTSREQEAAELKSRVKQLEDISAKDQRLISMKDSEIADLQKKLRDLQARAAAPAASVPAKTADVAPAKTAEPPASAAKPDAARPDQKITAKDIWGDLNAADAKTAAKPAAPSTPAPTTTTAASPTPAPSTASAAVAAASPAAAPSTATATPVPAPRTASATDTAPNASTSTVAAAPSTADTSSSPVKPASSTAAAKPTPAAKVTPLEPPAEPFYRNQNVLLGGGAALVLIGLLALMRFVRKPKPVFAGIGDPADDAAGLAGSDDEELRLRDALQQNPGNVAASLELLRHYYAIGDATKFEAAAETMHANLADTGAPEWDEVLAMGAVLAPNHPLFSEVAAEPAMLHEPVHAETLHDEMEHQFAYPQHEPEAEPVHMEDQHTEDHHTQIGTFDFEPVRESALASANSPTHDDGFDFDLPVHTEEQAPPATTIAHIEPEPVLAHAMAAHEVHDVVAPPQEDIYLGEDAIGTKLDLAKAYLDMGDPEGAKSMLDEVMSEGNDVQRDEARKLIAEIR